MPSRRLECLLLDENSLKRYVDIVVVVPPNANPLKKCRAEMAKEKRMILNRVKDHVVFHIASRGTIKEMWDALYTLYQGYFEQ